MQGLLEAMETSGVEVEIAMEAFVQVQPFSARLRLDMTNLQITASLLHLCCDKNPFLSLARAQGQKGLSLPQGKSLSVFSCTKQKHARAKN